MFTLAFLIASTERAIKSGAQFVLLTLGTGIVAGSLPGEAAHVINGFTLDWLTLGGVFVGGVLVSYLTSVLSAPFGSTGPSVANESAEPRHAA